MGDSIPRWHKRLRAAIRPALAWSGLAALMGLAAVGLGLWQRGFGLLPRTAIALAVLALPPAVVVGLAAISLDTLLPRLQRKGRAIGMALLLFSLGPLASAAVFSLIYRQTYPVGFQPIWTEVGFHQLAWTGIATLVLFAAHGLRLYLPFGPIAGLVLALAYGFVQPAALRRPSRSDRQTLTDHSTPDQQ
ncbi:hypothetical protein EDC22_11176 [Tepidamorphus gemmatus]|jgi:hypothetical protein|uniref:Uncharacterized protein n=1 Tax=Tepidamorphus gemmatus TaxID=747076 RepID=A0A4R3M1B2_9HYPH|nr:hypothetical protein [Tepidamorphus gemmatus]TCT06493.1 hypothetical protein EDC22_11176 [Tepidamorphus gemmatus]